MELHGPSGRAIREYFYWTEPVAAEPIPSDTFSTNGLVELIALDERELIAVERSFSVGVGNAIKLFLTAPRLDRRPGYFTRKRGVGTMDKALLIDLDVLGLPLDNIEGISFGPVLPSGRRSLILVSDNNFSETQFTQFLAFEVLE